MNRKHTPSTTNTTKRYVVTLNNGFTVYVGNREKDALAALMNALQHAEGFRFSIEDFTSGVVTEWKRV